MTSLRSVVKIPDDGDVMTKEDFISACESGGFIDYDGFGHGANPPTMDESCFIKPSEVLKKGFPEGFSHVVWFNR